MNYLEKSMKHLLTNPDHQPKHKVVVYPDGIFFFLDKHLAISLNEFKKMHFSRVAQSRQMYKSAIDYLLLKVLSPNNFTVSDKGIKLIKPLFDKCEIKWRLGFKDNRVRDNNNYIQKTLQDAIVDTGIIKDDNYMIVDDGGAKISHKFGHDYIGVLIVGNHTCAAHIKDDDKSSSILELNDDNMFDIIVKE